MSQKRTHPELIRGIRVQYRDRDSKTRAGRITKRTGNKLTIVNALKEKSRIDASAVIGYWRERVKASPQNLILLQQPINRRI